MILIKADRSSEAGILPDKEFLDAMGRLNQEMVRAGALLVAEGLHPSSKGARVAFSGDKRTVTDGPFTETKELVAGFYLIQVKSKEEAIEWTSRMPLHQAEVEVRQVFDPADLPAGTFFPEDAARAQVLRSDLETS
jgi:hypothetical protein